jgi:hypothetical protein
MKLDSKQLEALRAWATQGETLSTIQKKLETELNLRLTYMDLRFLLDDYGIELGKKPAPAPEKKEEPAAEEAVPEEGEAEEMEIAGAVQVEADLINRPGTLMSGAVTFSDGVKAKWYLDQSGRLGLEGVDKGYRPATEDVQDFQMQLQKILQKKGY